METPTTFHLRVKLPRAYGRPGYSAAHFQRVTNTYPTARTVCGAECTEYDVTRSRDLRDWVRPADSRVFTSCQDCGGSK